MNEKRYRSYLAGGWFSPKQNEVLTSLEDMLRKKRNIIHYFPRHDGVKLSSNDLHDHKIRERVFFDNVEHIKSADFILAACDGTDGFYDQGTQWEIGYAMAIGIPVIAYDPSGKTVEKFAAIKNNFYSIYSNIDDLSHVLDEIKLEITGNEKPFIRKGKDKVLFIGPDDTYEQIDINTDIVSTVILECQGSDFRWLDILNNPTIGSSMTKILEGINYIVAVIDDRHPIVSWLLGYAYALDIPVVTYTNHGYGINVMLNCSLLTHCRGKEELKKVMQKIKRSGISSIPVFDDSHMKVY